MDEQDFDFKSSVLQKAQKESRGSRPSHQKLLESAEEVTDQLLTNHYNVVIKKIADLSEELDDLKSEDVDDETVDALQMKLRDFIEEQYGVEGEELD